MDIRDEQLRDDAKTTRKPYRKPAVQVYGTLTQMTGNTPGKPSAFKKDSGTFPSSTHRT
jgi:hypothetical protein